MDIKQFALAVHNFAYGTNWDDEDIVSAMDFETIVEKMKNDEKQLEDVKEGLAQKFYDHYGGQGTDTLYFARQTGPDLGNMVDFVLKENKELKEKNETLFEDGYDAGREEYQVDQEFLDEKDQEIEELKETIRNQGDQLVVFHAKEEKPDTNSSTCVKVICEIKDDEIKQLKEQVNDLQQNYDRLRSVHSKVVQDLNARTEKVIEMTLQQQ